MVSWRNTGALSLLTLAVTCPTSPSLSAAALLSTPPQAATALLQKLAKSPPSCQELPQDSTPLTSPLTLASRPLPLSLSLPPLLSHLFHPRLESPLYLFPLSPLLVLPTSDSLLSYPPPPLPRPSVTEHLMTLQLCRTSVIYLCPIRTLQTRGKIQKTTGTN